jgi:hypothetical protein
MPCNTCAKANRKCGPKRRSDEDKPIRDENMIEDQYWENLRKLVKRRRQRRQSWEDILDLVDPDGVIAPLPAPVATETDFDAPELPHTYPASGTDTPTQAFTAANPTPASPTENTFGYPATSFGVTQSQYGPPPNSTANFDQINQPYQYGFNGGPGIYFPSSYAPVHPQDMAQPVQTVDPGLLSIQPTQQPPIFWNNAAVSNSFDDSTEYIVNPFNSFPIG